VLEWSEIRFVPRYLELTQFWQKSARKIRRARSFCIYQKRTAK